VFLATAAVGVAAEAGSQPSTAAATTTPASAPATQPQAAPDNTVLFMDWLSIQKTHMLPTYDANRLSDEGRKILEEKKKAGYERKLTGHGMEAKYKAYGIRIALEKARKLGPFLVADQPWEGTIAAGATVIRDGDRYRCWYCVFLKEAKIEVISAQGRTMEVSGLATCYAESTDGLHWTKPSLGLHSYNGNKDNNIVAPFPIAVFKDPAGKDEERFKGLTMAELPADELTEKTLPYYRYGVYGVISSDGMHWTRLPKPAVRHFCDTWNIMTWDSLLKKYVGFFRDHQGGRAIGIATSEDFHNWSPMETLLANGPEDGPNDDYYSNGYTTYPGRPDLRLLFPAIYHQDTDLCDVHLAISNDGEAYNWVTHEAILDVGKEGEWDSGQLYAQPDLIYLPDGRLALPYAGYDHTHNAIYTMYKDYKSRDGLAWAVWDDGRLAGVRADDVGEFYVCAPTMYGYSFTLNGPEILVNYRVDEGGKVEVELLERGKTQPLPGFSLADCEPLTGDKIWAPVRWKGQDLSSLKGKELVIHFRLTRAKVFGYKAPDVK
jgi:hypothetical protein